MTKLEFRYLVMIKKLAVLQGFGIGALVGGGWMLIFDRTIGETVPAFPTLMMMVGIVGLVGNRVICRHEQKPETGTEGAP